MLVRADGECRCGLVFWAGHGSTGPGNCGHIEADGLIVEHHGERVVTCWQDSTSGGLSVAAGAQTHGYDVRLLDTESVAFAVADSCAEKRLTWTVVDTTIATLRSVEGSKWRFRVFGQAAGRTRLGSRTPRLRAQARTGERVTGGGQRAGMSGGLQIASAQCEVSSGVVNAATMRRAQGTCGLQFWTYRIPARGSSGDRLPIRNRLPSGDPPNPISA